MGKLSHKVAVLGPRGGVELVSILKAGPSPPLAGPSSPMHAQLLGCRGQFSILLETERARGPLSWPARRCLRLWASKGLWSVWALPRPRGFSRQ